MQPLLDFMSILALMQQVWPRSEPAFISAHNFMFCSTARETERRSSVRLQKQAGGRITLPGPTVASAFRVKALLPLLFHLIRRRIVDVGLSLSQQLFTKLQNDGKMVAGVGELVWADLKHGNIFQNHLWKDKKGIQWSCFCCLKCLN